MILHRKTFHVVRHGQTTDNAAGLISGGGRDPDLTDAGRSQALDAAGIFANLTPDPSRIIVSALRRTHQTAQLITNRPDFHVDERLNERYLGELDGRISEEEQKRLGALPGEEAVADQALRVLAALNHHLSESTAPLFVVHGGTIRRILEAAGLKGKVEAHNGVIYTLHPASGDAWNIRNA